MRARVGADRRPRGYPGPVAEHGFILTPTYRIVAGRPAVHLYAVLENGEPALIVDDRARPYFFVRARDEAAARRAAGDRLEPVDLRAFDGEPVVRVEADDPEEVVRLRTSLGKAGVECLEADVRFAYRYLIDRGIRGWFAVDGPWERRPGIGRIYKNPEIAPAELEHHRPPRLSVLSIDIETSLDGERLYSIGMAGAGGEHVFMVGDPEGAEAAAMPGYVEIFDDERPLLERFIAHVREADPDVLTGWSLPDFDLPALLRYARRARLRLEIGRGPGEVVVRRDPGMTREGRATLPGRVVLDGLALVRGAFFRLDDYKLETAAQAILGRGKLFGPEGRGHQIESAFREDPASLAAYNLEDARLVLEILERTGLVELSVRRSLLTGMQPDRVSSQIAAVDTLYLAALRARGRVAPSVDTRAAEESMGEGIAGGLVLDSVPGLHRNIAVYDFKSLYPSIIRTFNIDPLTHAGDISERSPREGEIPSPGGAIFRTGEDGILPALVARLWDERGRARAAGDERGALAIKILMNSLFGVLGSPASRLFSPAVANGITLAGQHVIRLAAAAAEAEGHRVLYGDTDSLFVDLGEPDFARAAARADALRVLIGDAVARSLAADFGCRSYLELELEKIYPRFFMPEMRGSAQGSKKRYAGLISTRRGEIVEIVGLEAVRRDASAVARRFQRELLHRVFHDQPVGPFVRRFVEDLRAGKLDAELVYRKALRKPLDAYTKTTPPHVKAARLLGAEAGRVVAYVVTRAGPEPVGATTARPDYEHYVTQQLRPIADSILHALGGPDFDDMIGARRQLSLF